MAEKLGFLISIITVVKDDFAGFVKTSNSILPRLGTEVEWLIIDGSENKDIGIWCTHNLRGSNTSYHWQSPQGIYAAMNYGVAMSHGKWIWFINSGDLLLNNKSISQILQILANSSEWKILALPVLYLTPNNKFYTVVKPSVISINGYMVAGFHHQGVVVERTVFDSNGGFDATFQFAADGKFLDSAITKFKFHLSSYLTCGFMMGGNSMQNYSLSLTEAMKYRPKSIVKSNRLLLLRNKARFLLIKFEDLPLINLYIKFRHNRTYKEILAFDEEFNGLVS